ncbi:MAG: VOC family protein, partial [Alkalibacterium sp.]
MFEIDKKLDIHSVDLNVKNLKEMTRYYEEKIGLDILEETNSYVSLGVKAEKHVLMNLIEIEDDEPQTKKAGLFHTAFLLPTRKDLGNVLFALLSKDIPVEGASDHGYSEAIYLTDPEGNGIE